MVILASEPDAMLNRDSPPLLPTLPLYAIVKSEQRQLVMIYCYLGTLARSIEIVPQLQCLTGYYYGMVMLLEVAQSFSMKR